MQTSANGRKFLEHEEGLMLEAYQDEKGVWTIGYGHTGPEVKRGQRYTEQRADQVLTDDLVRFERCLNSECRIPPTQNQFDALVSLAFNEGVAAISSSTALRRYNANDIEGAADGFLLFDKITKNGVKVVSRVLWGRRRRERALFLT